MNWVFHDDVIKWRYWPFVRGIHRSTVNSPHRGQWRRALVFSLICVWINGWVHKREAGDLRRYRAHYDVIVMFIWYGIGQAIAWWPFFLLVTRVSGTYNKTFHKIAVWQYKFSNMLPDLLATQPLTNHGPCYKMLSNSSDFKRGTYDSNGMDCF